MLSVYCLLPHIPSQYGHSRTGIYQHLGWSHFNAALHKNSSFSSHATCWVGSLRLLKDLQWGQSFRICPLSLQFQHLGTLFEGFECSWAVWRRSLSVCNQASSADKRCTCLESSSSCTCASWMEANATPWINWFRAISSCCLGPQSG